MGGNKQFRVELPLEKTSGFLSKLKSFVDLRFIVECHDVTSASTALITTLGGRSVAGRALKPFRKLLSAFVQTHRAIIFATGNASRSVDCIEKDLAWVDLLDPSVVLTK